MRPVPVQENPVSPQRYGRTRSSAPNSRVTGKNPASAAGAANARQSSAGQAEVKITIAEPEAEAEVEVTSAVEPEAEAETETEGALDTSDADGEVLDLALEAEAARLVVDALPRAEPLAVLNACAAKSAIASWRFSQAGCGTGDEGVLSPVPLPRRWMHGTAGQSRW